jgi:hypothetical protein
MPLTTLSTVPAAKKKFLPDQFGYTSNPFDIAPHPDVTNPVLSPSDVTDASSTGVADPTIYVDTDNTWHMLFEVLKTSTDIAHATSQDGLSWTYDQIVINDSNKDAFPYLFRVDGDIYLAIQSKDGGGTQCTTLFQKGSDWQTWNKINTDLFGLSQDYADTAIFKKPSGGAFYAFVTDYTNDDLLLYYNTGDFTSTADWTVHPDSPIRSTSQWEMNTVFRYGYGESDHALFLNENNTEVYGFSVDTLTTSSYSDTIQNSGNPVLAPSAAGDWRDDQMHAYNAVYNGNSNGELLVAVDGQESDGTWHIGIYQ